MITVGVLKEPSFESRVSLLAAEAAALIKAGMTVWIEAGAAMKAFCTDADYVTVGAVIKSRTDMINTADVLLSINYNDIGTVVKDKVLIGVFQPLFNKALMEAWTKQGLTIFSLDMLPRITRAQGMDVLSSQANIAGYKSVLLAASLYPHYFPMMMTAAGSVTPAKVLVIGAGVAGLQAVATARRLGAVVEVFDTRAAAKEEVLSLGAKFIDVEGAADASKAGGYAVDQNVDFQQKQKASIAEHIKKADIVITTAQLFGRKAPVLVTGEMIGTMKAGSIIILASTVPADASKLYGKNVSNFIKLLVNAKGALDINLADEIVKGACVATGGTLTTGGSHITGAGVATPVTLKAV